MREVQEIHSTDKRSLYRSKSADYCKLLAEGDGDGFIAGHDESL